MADKTSEVERIYTIPLRKAKDLVRSRRAQHAVRDVQRYLQRHMKAEVVWVDNAVNEALWSQGKFHIPSRIRVRATRFSDGVVEVTMPETTTTGSVRTQIQERREKAAETPILKAPEPEEPEAGDLGARPVTDVKGVGPAIAEKLEKADVRTLADLAEADVAKLSESTHIGADRLSQFAKDAKAIIAGELEVADKAVQDALEETAGDASESKESATPTPAGKDAKPAPAKPAADATKDKADAPKDKA